LSKHFKKLRQMKMMITRFGLLVFLFGLGQIFANNITISNVSLTGQNTSNQSVRVQFDVSWENSWRLSVGPANWDAAWIFVKYRVSGGDWAHATLNYVNGNPGADGHTAPAGGTTRTAPDGKGIFIYRNADGSGNVNYAGVQLRWNYGADGVGDGDLVDVQVFGIEMVYVPQGAFRLGTGSGGTEANRFYVWPFGNAYQISSENAVNVAPTFGTLYYINQPGSSGGDQQGPVPAAFPKGYEAFYCMKYEVSQGQYVDFFNTLTSAQKADRDITNSQHKNSDGTVARNTIAYTSGSATTTTPDRPLNYVSSDDYLAYLDWSGLRPMTEFEYEKACRGTQTPVPDEFAWGNANIYEPTSPFTILNDGTPSARVSNPGTLIGNSAIQPTASGFGGPFRCGIFAASAQNKTREETGGSYYGIMELTGNLYERTVSIGHPDGRAFSGLHGDGILTANGEHNVLNWPSLTTGAIGYRGGSYANGTIYCRVSDRFDAANTANIVNSRIGFRGVRTAN
jgi:formylglycine-generating enzyme required for sulfatase activity